jgi:hypothetical protein
MLGAFRTSYVLIGTVAALLLGDFSQHALVHELCCESVYGAFSFSVGKKYFADLVERIRFGASFREEA